MSRYQADQWEPYDQDSYPGGLAPLPHSGLGIASFLIGLIVVVLPVLVLVLLAVLAASGKGYEEGRVLGTIFGLMVCGGCVLSLVGLGFGIGALFQAGRRRTYAVIGLALNGFVIFAAAALVLIGLLVAG